MSLSMAGEIPIFKLSLSDAHALGDIVPYYSNLRT